MSRNICFIAFGTFGNPNGFKQTFFIGGNADIAKSIKTFDLKTDAIRLFTKSKIYSVRKELVNGFKAISYSVYTYAKEQNSHRGGTFIGSAILYLDNIAEESHTIICLNEFHDTLISKNVQNDIIAVNHSDKFIVSKPVSYEKTETGIREIEDLNSNQLSNKNLVVYSEVSPARLQYLFKKALDLLNVYDTIYFTPSNEVAEFVHQKNLFQLVQTDGFEKELFKLQEEKKQHILSLVAEYENEKQKLEEDKKKVLDEWKEQMDANEKIHQKNKSILDESKQEYNNLTQTYEGYGKSISNAMAQLVSGKKPDLVKQLHVENKKIFTESVNEQKKPAFLNNIPKPKANTNIKPGFPQNNYTSEFIDTGSRRSRHKKQRLNKFKIASFILLLLWVGTICYFLLFTKKENNLAELPKPEIQAPVVMPPAPQPIIPELNPKPNAKLTGNAFRTVIKSMKPHASADDIVSIIFDSNPDAIKKVYDTQKQAYKKYLVEQNADYFEKKDSTFYVKNDTLVTIPSYKAQEK